MPDSRRQYGTGSIYQRHEKTCPPIDKATGERPEHDCQGRWMGVLQTGWTPRGTRRTTSVSAMTEKDCRAKLNKRRRQLADNQNAAPAGRTTVKSWAGEWLPLHAREVRPKAYTTDAGAVRKWIIPTIGTKRLTSLTPADVRAVHNAITTAGRTSTTARQAHWVLSKMLKAAAQEGHQVPANVIAVKAPREAVHDRDAIDLPDALLLLDAAHQRTDVARWSLALLYGMRQAEALGLTWDAVDLTGRMPRLSIEWQLQSLPYADRAAGIFRVPEAHESRHLTGSWHLVRPKSKRGYRVVPLVPRLHDQLAAWREHATDNPWGLLWTGRDTRAGRDRVIPRSPVNDRIAWTDLQDAAQVARVDGTQGRRYILHEARHTAATMLLIDGVDPVVISAILGHSVQASKSYKHVSTALASEALEGVAKRLGMTGPASLD